MFVEQKFCFIGKNLILKKGMISQAAQLKLTKNSNVDFYSQVEIYQEQLKKESFQQTKLS